MCRTSLYMINKNIYNKKWNERKKNSSQAASETKIAHWNMQKKKTCNNNRARDKKDSHFFSSLFHLLYFVFFMSIRGHSYNERYHHFALHTHMYVCDCAFPVTPAVYLVHIVLLLCSLPFGVFVFFCSLIFVLRQYIVRLFAYFYVYTCNYRVVKQTSDLENLQTHCRKTDLFWSIDWPKHILVYVLEYPNVLCWAGKE